MSEITELTLSLTAEDERNIFGGNDSYIRKIEKSLSVEIIDRNGQLHIIGDKEGANRASQIIRELVTLSPALVPFQTLPLHSSDSLAWEHSAK